MTWGVWQIFTTALESLKIEVYRRVMCHDNEEWCKIWRGIDLFKIGMKNLTDVDPSTQKSQKFAL